MLERRLERAAERPCAASTISRDAATTSSSGASESRPATGSGSSASTSAPSTTTIPPPRFASRRTAAAIDASFMPTTTTLCASWATVDAIAPALQAEAADEAEPGAPRAQVPLDHRDLRQVAVAVGDRLARSPGRLVDERVGDDLAGHDPDHPSRAALPRDPEHLGPERADPHRVTHPVRHDRVRDLGDRPAALQDEVGDEAARGRAGPTGRRGTRGRPRRSSRGGATGGVVRGADEGVLRRNAERHRLAHHRVDVAVVCDVLGLAVVGAERDPAGAVLGEQRQQRAQVPRGGRLSDQEPHPEPQAFASLLDGVGLVIRADARGRVGVQVAADDTGGVPVDVLRQGELRKLGLARADHAGEVHHLREADHAPAAKQGVEVARCELAAR